MRPGPADPGVGGEPQILKDWVMDLKAREFLISRIDILFGWHKSMS